MDIFVSGFLAARTKSEIHDAQKIINEGLAAKEGIFPQQESRFPEHTCLHVVIFCLRAGPVIAQWMCPGERANHTCDGFNRNKMNPLASIVKNAEVFDIGTWEAFKKGSAEFKAWYNVAKAEGQGGVFFSNHHLNSNDESKDGLWNVEEDERVRMGVRLEHRYKGLKKLDDRVLSDLLELVAKNMMDTPEEYEKLVDLWHEWRGNEYCCRNSTDLELSILFISEKINVAPQPKKRKSKKSCQCIQCREEKGITQKIFLTGVRSKYMPFQAFIEHKCKSSEDYSKDKVLGYILGFISKKEVVVYRDAEFLTASFEVFSDYWRDGMKGKELKSGGVAAAAIRDMVEFPTKKKGYVVKVAFKGGEVMYGVVKYFFWAAIGCEKEKETAYAGVEWLQALEVEEPSGLLYLPLGGGFNTLPLPDKSNTGQVPNIVEVAQIRPVGIAVAIDDDTQNIYFIPCT